jgi:hypothetical protein
LAAEVEIGLTLLFVWRQHLQLRELHNVGFTKMVSWKLATCRG